MTAPLASGREADVYALDNRRVLRRYRRITDVTDEAATMAYVAELGYPVPAVYEANGSDMVLERLAGPTMAQAMADGTLPIGAAAVMLANLLGLLHDLPAPPGLTGSILHLDLHPENVLITGRGPVVIDWVNATDGEPDLDTGLSALIVAQVAIEKQHPWSEPAGAFLDAFLPVAPGDPFRLLEQVIEFRSGQLTLSEDERGRLEAAADRMRGAV